MTQQVFISGMDTENYGDAISRLLSQHQPKAIGIAAAFVSIGGMNKIIKIIEGCGEVECRLVAGIDNAITHPEALLSAQKRGWKLRLGFSENGIFHPKLIITGNKFVSNGSIKKLSCVYVGSSNLTSGGFKNNVECGLISETNECPPSASTAFAKLWNAAGPATDRDIRNYAALFAERARNRTVTELIDLGISDSQPLLRNGHELIAQSPPTRQAFGVDFATVAWAGLQSFTGEYRFQLEFPRNAGKVIRHLIHDYAHGSERIDVYCQEDEVTREMQYRFYADNSMFRLNIPNDTPGVDRARISRQGIAVVERGPLGGAPLRLRFLRPGSEADEVISRSEALGMWGKTSTRIYGWY